MKQNKMLRLLERLQRLSEQRHIYAIHTSFLSTMPIMIAGAFAVAINNLPIPAYQSFMEFTLGARWRMFGSMCYNGTSSIVTIMVVFLIGYNLATWHVEHRKAQIHPVICGLVGLACYTIVSIPVESEAIPFSMAGVTGLFMSMLVAVLVTELFVLISSTSKAARVLTSDPSIAVPLSFAAVKPTLIIVALVGVFRVVLVFSGVEEGLYDIVAEFLRRPFQNRSNSLGTAYSFTSFSQLMWIFGIHGNNVLDDVAKTVFSPAMVQNVQAAAAGLAPPNLVTKTLFDAFVYMGGSGTTLGLLLALRIFGNRASNRTLLRYALPTAIFNINEPFIFGAPIVLNPVYAIPFVLTPVVMLSTTVLSMQLGWVPYTIQEVSWATPIGFSGYMATGSAAGVVLQLVNITLAVLIYAPFVRVSERLSQLRFKRAYSDLNKSVTADYASVRLMITRTDEVGAVARRLANQLDTAIQDGELYLHYQPIVDARTNTMHSLEALLRWKHPQHGLINPMVTVALAEETGRIDTLGLWIMEQALQQRAEWTQQGVGDFHVSVNVSTRQLDAPDFCSKVKSLLKQYKVPSAQLQIEITETVALLENENTRANLAQFHASGVTIAMDDFGVGHSSLLYLRTQPVTTLKIDGSLSSEVIRHPESLGIISTIHDLCKLLNMASIVEVVETQQQLELLMGIGLYLIQGYYFSPPIPGDEIPKFMLEVQERPLSGAVLPQENSKAGHLS